MEKEKVKSEQRIATNLAEAARREKKKEEKIRDRRTNGFSWWVRRSGERSL
jgi:hypothetical protein